MWQLKKMSNNAKVTPPPDEPTEGVEQVPEQEESGSEKESAEVEIPKPLKEKSTAKENGRSKNSAARRKGEVNLPTTRKRKERKKFSREEISKTRYKTF